MVGQRESSGLVPHRDQAYRTSPSTSQVNTSDDTSHDITLEQLQTG